MAGELSKQFHKQTNHEFPIGFTKDDMPHDEESWDKVARKEYARMEKILLPRSFIDLVNVTGSLKNLSLSYDNELEQTIDLQKLSALLFYSAGAYIDDRGFIRRFYHSEKSLYPLEVYLVIQNIKDMNQGIYHYDVKGHALAKLIEGISVIDKLRGGLPYQYQKEASLMVIITSVWERNLFVSGNQIYRSTLIELGQIAQNLSLITAVLKTNFHQSTVFNNKLINEVLDITREGEDSLWMAFLGKSKI